MRESSGREGIFKKFVKEKKGVLAAAFVSLAAHAGAYLSFNEGARHDLENDTAEISRTLREKWQMAFSSEQSEEEFKKQLLELEKVDVGAALLKMESLHGFSEAETEQAIRELSRIREEYDRAKTGLDLERTGFNLSKEVGRYDSESTSLIDLLNKKQGNCVARAKFYASVLPSVSRTASSERNVQLQWFAGDEQKPPHVRTLFKDNAGIVWYAFEAGLPTTLAPADLAGTVTTDSRALLGDALVTSFEEKNFTDSKELSAQPFLMPLDAKAKTVVTLPHAPTQVYEGGNAKLESQKDFIARQAVTLDVARAQQAERVKSSKRLQVELLTPDQIAERFGKDAFSKKDTTKKGENREVAQPLSGEELTNVALSGKFSLFLGGDSQAPTDLSPLAPFSITEVIVAVFDGAKKVTGWEAFRGKEVSRLMLSGLEITDEVVQNFADSPLKDVALNVTSVVDVSFLKGKKLDSLSLKRSHDVDLRTLQGVTFDKLSLSFYEGMDLSPIKEYVDSKREKIAKEYGGLVEIDASYRVHLLDPSKSGVPGIKKAVELANEGDSAAIQELQNLKIVDL
jgi:hypothetical protein